MANEVNIKVKVKNGHGGVRESLPVLLLNPDLDHPFNPQPTVVVASGDTGLDGCALLMGITAGLYDIKVIVSGEAAWINNYEVKNSFVTNPDQLPFESRFAVRSAESVISPGILTQNKAYGTGTFTGGTQRRTQYDTPGPQVYQNSLGTIFTGTETLAGKQSGNSYYHDNQNNTFTQRADIVVTPL